MRPFCYYQTVVISHLKKNSPGRWQARCQVNKGKRVKIVKVDTKIRGGGANEPEILAALKKFPIKENDYLDHEVYETAKSNLLNLIGNLDFSDVKTEKKRLIIDPHKNSAELTLYINTGEKYFLGQFRFYQNSLQPDFLNRYIGDVKPGDPFSQKGLLALQQSLIISGYFSVIDIKPEYSEAQQQVPIDITLTPAKRHKLSFGFGYDTEIELNTSKRWQNRLLNRYGHNSDVLLKVSDKKVSCMLHTGSL